MTVEYLRDLMREKVVPEDLVPQNMINRFIDEDAEPPKLDAFAFLMRLRSLGIGSADFVNLLVGCGAPDEVVEKIRHNPAMNLQGLIVTLDNSELTTDDYTRMLLTARQVWERTLTLRLERSEKITQDLEDGKTADTMELPRVENAEDEDIDYPDDGEELSEDDSYYNYDEDMVELSFTAVLDRINEETLAEKSETVSGDSSNDTSNDSSNKDGDTFAAMFDRINAEVSEVSEEDNGDDLHSGKNAKRIFEGEELETPEKTDKPKVPEEQPKDLTFSQAFDKIKSGKQKETTKAPAESTDETDFVQVDEESLREKFEILTTEMEKLKPKTAKQVKSVEDEADYEDDDTDERPKRVYHKGAIIGGVIGAAVLAAAGFAVPKFLALRAANELRYAESNDEIFNKIYFAYTVDKISGGTAACSVGGDAHRLFGDLLITPSEENGLGSFSLGDTQYVVTEESISASIVENGSVTPLEALVPPESARFVAVFDEGGELYALFSGKQSGCMKVTDGKADYTIMQDGILTDFELNDGTLGLGTVYTPVFGHTFDIGDEDVYLPRLGTGEPKPISAKNVIVSSTNGYSYGVSAEYSTADGSPKSSRAVIGDPVAASADGCFAMSGDEGVLIKTDGEKPVASKTGKLSRAAFGRGVCAAAEVDDSGNVRLMDSDMKLKSILAGAPANITAMWFEGNVLMIAGSDEVSRVDCSDLSAPKPLALDEAVGVVLGNSAVTYKTTESALVITRWELENGTARKLAYYTRELSADRLSSVKFGSVSAVIVNGAQSGAAYSYFDGVSVDSVYVVFTEGAQPKTVSVFDDRDGFTAAFKDGDTIKAICAGGVKVPQ